MIQRKLQLEGITKWKSNLPQECSLIPQTYCIHLKKKFTTRPLHLCIFQHCSCCEAETAFQTQWMTFTIKQIKCNTNMYQLWHFTTTWSHSYWHACPDYGQCKSYLRIKVWQENLSTLINIFWSSMTKTLPWKNLRNCQGAKILK